ncbi:MAG TPA: MATE family efflux transporter [Candidatus Caccomorpha excrementavium]|nr:MATE family efflux transporter [Candidatus Caccomorpha excrementavium]
MAKKSYEIDMCNGPLLGKLLIFSLPLMLSGILQLLFNAADLIVVGQFATNSKTALAAVGSTGSLTNLIINVFIGLSVGSNVLVARFYGAKRNDEVNRVVHTSIMISIIFGIFLAFFGVATARYLLELMDTPEDVLDQATLYMRIYFAGMPVIMLYNFGSAILRAMGDTKRPLYYLLIAGIVNVILNLIFVIQFHLDVAGVAIATVISQAISAALIVLSLTKSDGPCRLNLRKLRIHKTELLRMAQIGLPAGFQGAIFSISNVLIQSSINSFGSTAMAGSTASANIEGFVYTAMNTFHHTAVNFTSQNLGAHKFDRIKKSILLNIVLVSIVGILLGGGAYLLGPELLRIYNKDAEVVSYGMIRLLYVCVPYFLCGIMDTLVGGIRGMGVSVLPMFTSLIGACGLRILWIYTIFQWDRTLPVLFLSYPVTWLITALAHTVCCIIVYRRIVRHAGVTVKE